MVGPTNYKSLLEPVVSDVPGYLGADILVDTQSEKESTLELSIQGLTEYQECSPFKQYSEDLSSLQRLLKQLGDPKSVSITGHDRVQLFDLEKLRKEIESHKSTLRSSDHLFRVIPDSSLQKEIFQLRVKSEEQYKRHSEEINQLQSQQQSHLNAIHREYEMLEQAKLSTKSALDDAHILNRGYEQNINYLETTISAQSQALLQLKTQQSSTKCHLESASKTLQSKIVDIKTIESQLCEARSYISQMEDKLRYEETTRRRLHNTIQELKGNIRVFCRMCPLLRQRGDLLQHIFSSDNEIELFQNQESANGSKTIIKSYPFSFDKIFKPNTTQSEIFEEISQLVQSAVDGYPVCIFAYGQTGSGKTFTMEGPEQPNPETVGIIPRSVLQIYSTIKSLKQKGWEYTMEGQFLEIYNDTIHDLLGNGDLNKKHDIRHVASGKTMVSGLTTVIIDSPEKMTAVMKRAVQNRAVASTHCNGRSSRSHSVFMLRLSGKNTISGEVSEGLLNLIDLAGSERLSQSGSTGDRLRETQAINKSLSCLGDVIHSLTNKEGYVPYRNSKLTYLLQNSLGGNSKTLMFVNVSSCHSHFQETLSSLRFASKVNSCHIGVAKRITK